MPVVLDKTEKLKSAPKSYLKGNVLDSVKFEQMRQEFYELMGWSPGTGLQRVETLKRLKLADVIENLKEKGLAE